MTSILLVPFHPPGHAEPTAALGMQLAAQGHVVHTFGESAAGRWKLGGPLPPELVMTADGGTLFRHMFLGDVDAMTLDIVDCAVAYQAEVIVADVMMPGGGLAAQTLGLPWATVCCSPVPELDAFRRFIPEHAIAAFRGLLGRTSPWLHLLPTTPRFAGFPDLGEEVALVGPLTTVPAAPRQRLAEDTVVVTASTAEKSTLGGAAYLQDRYMAEAKAALAGMDAHGVVTQPGVFTPHDVLFDKATAVVTHAGWGTVSRALVRGLPLVLVPIANDQTYIAQRCAELGFGIALTPDQVNAAELREAIHLVLSKPDYRAAAAEFAAELRAAPPLPAAAALISSIATVSSARKG